MAVSLNVGDNFVIQSGGKRLRANLHRGYQSADDGILWGLQRTSFIASSYSPEQLADAAYAQTCEAINQGDVVAIEGVNYSARVLGDFSDCVVFNPV